MEVKRCHMKRRLPGGSAVKNPSAMQEPETWIQSLCQEDHLEGMANHSSILALKMPWTEVPSGLQSIESQRIRQDWSNLAHTCARAHTHSHEENIKGKEDLALLFLPQLLLDFVMLDSSIKWIDPRHFWEQALYGWHLFTENDDFYHAHTSRAEKDTQHSQSVLCFHL